MPNDDYKIYFLPEDGNVNPPSGQSSSSPYTLPQVANTLTQEAADEATVATLSNLQDIIRVRKGQIQSGNFVTGVSGWQILATGNAEFNTGTFRGSLVAGSIDIPDTVSANSFHTDNMGNSWWGATTFGAAPASISKTGAAIFTSATISGVLLSTVGAFGGDGTDGALTISSGTTTISLANAAVVVKNYTSISITGTGILAFSNPSTTGTKIVLKSQGAVTLTSSSAPMINCVSLGAPGGAGGTSSGNGSDGTNAANILDDLTTHKGLKNGTIGNPSVGGIIYSNLFLYLDTVGKLPNRYVGSAPGSGGGGGAAGNSTGNIPGGAGGAGGGTLLIECNGALNFTTASGISVAGGAGTNGTNNGSAAAGEGSGGGGGGGAGGAAIILYKTLTSSSGTITVIGGAGGNGGTFVSVTGPSGNNGAGSGAGGYGSAGGAGGQSATNGTAAINGGGAGGTSSGGNTNAGGGGGGGAAGFSLVAQNTSFA